MKNFGLIGKSLGHSFSKEYFSSKFNQLNLSDHCYSNFEMKSLKGLRQLIDDENIQGLNVTIPYKEKVIALLDEVDEVATDIGAVNTIRVSHSSSGLHLKGFNTDAFGFKKSIKPFLNTDHERALILGNGGAAKAIVFVMKEYGLPYTIVSRNPSAKNEIHWDDVNEFVIKYHQLIINTTPLGTFPKVNQKPEIPYRELTAKHFLFDLTYNPIETEFMRLGKKNGAMAINGLSMLQHQADRAWEIWNANSEDELL